MRTFIINKLYVILEEDLNSLKCHALIDLSPTKLTHTRRYLWAIRILRIEAVSVWTPGVQTNTQVFFRGLAFSHRDLIGRASWPFPNLIGNSIAASKKILPEVVSWPYRVSCGRKCELSWTFFSPRRLGGSRRMSRGGILVKDPAAALGLMKAPAEKNKAEHVPFLFIRTERGMSRSHRQGWSETPGPPCIKQKSFPEDNLLLFEELQSDTSLPQELSLNTIHLNIYEVSFQHCDSNVEKSGVAENKTRSPKSLLAFPRGMKTSVRSDWRNHQLNFFSSLLQILIAPFVFPPSRQSLLMKCDFRFMAESGNSMLS